MKKWLCNKRVFALDLHCPWLKRARNEQAFFVGKKSKILWKRIVQYSKILEKVNKGTLIYKSKDNLPYGVDWNVGNIIGFSNWAGSLPGAVFSSTLETPYANARGGEVTVESARKFGRYLAKSIKLFLERSSFQS